MALAARLHWRLLIGTILVLMATAWAGPRFVRPPGIQENRVLAAKPAWPTHLRDLGEFRKAADAYVADHFPARPHSRERLVHHHIAPANGLPGCHRAD